jgi:hypothetical protein
LDGIRARRAELEAAAAAEKAEQARTCACVWMHVEGLCFHAFMHVKDVGRFKHPPALCSNKKQERLALELAREQERFAAAHRAALESKAALSTAHEAASKEQPLSGYVYVR